MTQCLYYLFILLVLRELKKNCFCLENVILFYADDTVILAESANDLQFINIVIYTVKWKLTVNICKTKIVVFSRGRQPKFYYVLTYNALPDEIATDFNFLGVVF